MGKWSCFLRLAGFLCLGLLSSTALGLPRKTIAQASYKHFLPLVVLNRPIAFESDRDGNYYHDLYLMQADGSGITRVNGPDSVLCPTLSPGGHNVLFVSTLRTDIYQVNVDGSGLTKLTDGARIEDSPVWAPDERFIVFTASDDLAGGIFAIRPGQSGETSLISSSAHSFWSPSWSPDGQRLAFSSNLEGNTEIYVVNVVSSSQTIRLAGPLIRLTYDTHWDSFPNWSPDGGHIVFESHRDGDPEIWTMRSDGTEQTQLTHNSVGDDYPVWSPDGSKIMFTSERDGNFEVYVMNADGSNPINLTNSPFWEGCASWLR